MSERRSLRCEIPPDPIGAGSMRLLGSHKLSALRRTFDQRPFVGVEIAIRSMSARQVIACSCTTSCNFPFGGLMQPTCRCAAGICAIRPSRNRNLVASEPAWGLAQPRSPTYGMYLVTIAAKPEIASCGMIYSGFSKIACRTGAEPDKY